MNESPTTEGLTAQLLLSVALSSLVCMVFVRLQQPLAYIALGLTVGAVLLVKRLRRPAPSGVPRWAPLAVFPLDTLLWPTAVLGDVLSAATPPSTDD